MLDSAFVSSENGDLLSAIHACQQAIVIEPASATAHSFLALLYERSGQTERAIEEYERALHLNPQSSLDLDSLERLRRKLNPSDVPATTVVLRRSSPYFDTTPVVVAATVAIMLLLGVHNYVNVRTQAAEERRLAARAQPQAQDNRLPGANLGSRRPNPIHPPTRLLTQLPASGTPLSTGSTGVPANPPNTPPRAAAKRARAHAVPGDVGDPERTAKWTLGGGAA